MAKIYYESLDGLRGLAVVIVLLAHGGSPYPISGGVGVDVFFVLSGFLITGILSSEAAAYGRVSLRNFYARRLLRLTPCLLLTCALVITLSWWFESAQPSTALVCAISYTANWAMALYGTDLGVLGHCWSLSIEEQYYLMWPLVIVTLERKVKGGTALKGLVLTCLALLASLYRCSMVGSYSAERIYYGLDTHMDGLIFGSALHYGVQLIREGGGISLAYSRAFSRVVVPFATVGLLLIMRMLAWWHPWMGKLGFTLVACAACVLIVDVTCSPASLLQRPLGSFAFKWTGKLSYGIYLYHYPLFHAVDSVLAPAPLLVLLGVKVVATVALATVSYFLVEIRYLELKRFFQPELLRSDTKDAVRISTPNET